MAWKIILWILLGLVAACGVVLLAAYITATVNNIGFVEQLKDWFTVGKETAEAITTAAHTLKI